MGFFSKLVRTVIKSTIILIILALLLTYTPNLPPFTQFSSVEIAPLKPREGVLSPNNILNNAQKLYKGQLLGPEAFKIYKDELFTSLANGEIVKISPSGQINSVTQIGQPCNGLLEEHICGRPLGFHIDGIRNVMYVADAYHGIWKVDLKTSKKQLLVSPHVEINGAKSKIFMTPILDKNGILYYDHVSTDFDLKDGVFTMLSDPSGRLFKYDNVRNKSELLLDKLWFPNGIVVSPDNKFLVIAETCHHRLTKYYINGPKKGTSELLVDGLPGVPDNIQALPDGSGMLVALYAVFDEDEPSLLRSVSKTPLLRKFISRLLKLVELPFEFLSEYYPHVMFDEIVYSIGHFKSITNLAPSVSGLLHIDWDGNIIASYFNTDGTVIRISDAVVFNDKLYMGSPHLQDYIAAVPVPPGLKKSFYPATPKQAESVRMNKKSEESKDVKKVKENNGSNLTKEKNSERKQEKKTTEEPHQQQNNIPQHTQEKSAKNQGNDNNIKNSQVPKEKPAASKSVPDSKAQPQSQTKSQKDHKTDKKPEHIPIKEELASDTVKPKQEKLKVIKKNGPVEMPIP